MEDKKIKKVIVVFEDEAPFIYEAKDEDDRKAAKLIYSALQDAARDGSFSAFVLAYKTLCSKGGNGAYGNTDDCFQMMSYTLSDMCFKASSAPSAAMDSIVTVAKKLLLGEMLEEAIKKLEKVKSASEKKELFVRVLKLLAEEEPSQK
ncbi:hypothetical protein [Cloacibacillus porcorum]|uniref:hypothetical protein n=1 Tax=Cloacibacillus porcorum TaxID=1197717 RepID=UPI0023F416E9|nr:hypothetical protein [Cloacibacillus porcorum]MCC8184983.1 hypothetical protein [Cloacibacillus porcorum]